VVFCALHPVLETLISLCYWLACLLVYQPRFQKIPYNVPIKELCNYLLLTAFVSRTYYQNFSIWRQSVLCKRVTWNSNFSLAHSSEKSINCDAVIYFKEKINSFWNFLSKVRHSDNLFPSTLVYPCHNSTNVHKLSHIYHWRYIILEVNRVIQQLH